MRFPPLRTFKSIGATLGLLALVAGPTTADILHMFSGINGAQEVPPSPSPGTGVGNMTIDTDLNTLDYVITYQNLFGPENQAHIHGFAPPGMNAGILEFLPIGSPKVGTWNYNQIDESGIVGDQTYTNIHTNPMPGGEIRGQNVVTARSVCWGDGSGTACPCGNAGTKGTGCANSSGGGAVVTPNGSNATSTDDMTFHGTNLLPSQPALLFVGNDILNGGNGVVFGDGLRCAGTNVVRLGVQTPDGGGNASWGPGLRATGGWVAGDTRHFQVWYRDPVGGPCAGGFNLSNALTVDFVASYP
jgi:hypothetical protein